MGKIIITTPRPRGMYPERYSKLLKYIIENFPQSTIDISYKKPNITSTLNSDEMSSKTMKILLRSQLRQWGFKSFKIKES